MVTMNTARLIAIILKIWSDRGYFVLYMNCVRDWSSGIRPDVIGISNVASVCVDSEAEINRRVTVVVANDDDSPSGSVSIRTHRVSISRGGEGGGATATGRGVVAQLAKASNAHGSSLSSFILCGCEDVLGTSRRVSSFVAIGPRDETAWRKLEAFCGADRQALYA
jgi:hypothetical protein